MALDTRKREGQQLLLRFSEGSDLRDRLDECAKSNNRSLTGEILHRLEASLQSAASGTVAPTDDTPVRNVDFTRLAEKVKWLEDRLRMLEKRN